ncbi:hypothetical protein HPP92_002061 [Vanilla planifolia]|uniref:Uncharacterized protein n=1 Tax=Vanilla planifolia TaxID=51239 RepID=A0A835RSC4_VANPL|nr:hypothetical protein HPP92_002321 [Vanilla planifolia]KAG0501989.1 hypothetical protein HPP92_002061 [Vanilla planifolia]
MLNAGRGRALSSSILHKLIKKHDFSSKSRIWRTCISIREDAKEIGAFHSHSRSKRKNPRVKMGYGRRRRWIEEKKLRKKVENIGRVISSEFRNI